MTAISLITAASVRPLELRPVGLRPAEARAAAKAIVDAPASGKTAAASEEAQKLSKGAAEARKEAAARAKGQARQKVERLVEELKLIKKIWASNPREMTKQLARLAKQLAAAAKEYMKAAKDAGELVQAPSAPAAASPPAAGSGAAVGATDSAQSDQAAAQTGSADVIGEPGPDRAEAMDAHPGGDADAAAGDGAEPAAEPAVTRSEAAAAYASRASAQARAEEKEIREERRMLAVGDQDFARLVKGVARKIRDLLQETRVKSAFTLREPLEKSEDYKEADRTLKDLEKEMDKVETDASAVINDPAAHADRIAMIRSA